jgi:cell division septal protein FtsQ
MILKKLFRKTKKKRSRKQKKSIRKAKGKQKLFLEFLLIIIVLSAIAGVFYFFSSQYFAIQLISCEKNNFSCDQETEFFDDIKGQNIFTVDTAKLKNKIKDRLMYVKNLEVKKQYPNKITIKINERQPQAALSQNNSLWYYVDESGFVFSQSYEAQDLPKINYKNYNLNLFLGQQISNDTVLKTIEIASLLKNNFVPFKEIKLNSQSEIIVELDSELQAFMSSNREVQIQVESLQFILRLSKIEGRLPASIDLRYAKPVVKYK